MRIRPTWIAVLLLLWGCDQAPAPAGDDTTAVTDPATIGPMAVPEGPLSRVAVPIGYEIDLRILTDEERFAGTTIIDFQLAEAVELLYLHGQELEVSRVELADASGQRVAATWEQIDPSGVARVTPAVPLAAGAWRLEIDHDAAFREGVEGLYKTSLEGEHYAFTQFEPIGARLVFPGFDDPQFKTPFRISVTTRTGHQAISTMPVTATEDLGDGLVRRTYAQTPPLPTYLIAFAVGPLDIVEAPPVPPNDVRDEPLPLRAAATRGKGPELAFALRHTPEILGLLEDYFGSPHPYPKLDLIASPDFGFAAMENVGAIIYGDPLLLLGEDDPPLRQLRGYAVVHAHELAHQWFGNLVTPVWWTDIWLNESFANWMGNRTAAAWRPDLEIDNFNTLEALGAMDADSRIAARAVREPVTRNADIASSFDGITYAKGGGILTMIESYMGEDAFRDGVRLHMQRFAHGNATADDFAESLARGSGQPELVPAFMSFIEQSGVPLLEVRRACDDDGARLQISQSRYLPLGSAGSVERTWGIPACFVVDDARLCQVLDAAEQTIELDACPDVVLPNAGGAGYYRFSLDAEGWSSVMGRLEEWNERELLAIADSLGAAFEADRIDFEVFADAAAVLATHPSRQVALAPLGTLRTVMRRMTDEPTRQVMQRWLARTYGPQLLALGYTERDGDSQADRLRRVSLAEVVAELAEAPEAQRAYAEIGVSWLGFDGRDADPDAISRDLLDTALTAAITTEGTPYATALQERMLASTDRFFRAQALRALTRNDDPDFAAGLRELALGDQLGDSELGTLLFGLGRNPVHTDSTFDWMQDHLQALTERLPFFAKQNLPGYAAFFCSEERAREAETFFTANLDAMPGGEQRLAEALESIRLCAALADAKRGEVLAYFDRGED